MDPSCVYLCFQTVDKNIPVSVLILHSDVYFYTDLFEVEKRNIGGIGGCLFCLPNGRGPTGSQVNTGADLREKTTRLAQLRRHLPRNVSPVATGVTCDMGPVATHATVGDVVLDRLDTTARLSLLCLAYNLICQQRSAVRGAPQLFNSPLAEPCYVSAASQIRCCKLHVDFVTKPKR